GSGTLSHEPAIPLCGPQQRGEGRFCPCSVPALRAIRTDVRRNRSDLLSWVEVYSGARRAGHLRAGPFSLFSMHPRPANLLSTPGSWHTLLCPQLYNTAIMLVLGTLPVGGTTATIDLYGRPTPILTSPLGEGIFSRF